MTAHEDRFIRIAGAIADFGHPFYAEERQRDVWNEASAFALALLSWAVLAAGAAMLWIGGSGAVPYVIVLLTVVGTCTTLAVVYAQRLGVEPIRRPSLRSIRTWAYLGIAAVYVGGLAWAKRDHLPLVAGFVTGMIVGVTAVAAVSWQRHRRMQRGEDF